MEYNPVFMERCLQLAALGAGHVAPNPLVGAVLVHQDRIIGEGFHQYYGQAHAEINCLDSVKEEDRHLIRQSTLYVSLEPCAHHGKTPPCSDRIIREGIPRVVIACRDPFWQVDGQGIEKLKLAHTELVVGMLEEEAQALNKRFFTFHQEHRPYVILKWAASANGLIGGKGDERILISNPLSNALVHRWRSEEAAILVGTTTALRDNPRLTARLPGAKNPVRLVIDTRLRLPQNLHLFDGETRTVVLTYEQKEKFPGVEYMQLDPAKPIVEEILRAMAGLSLTSMLVEGGARTIQTFIDDGRWDEARIITNESLQIPEGTAAPVLTNAKEIHEEQFRQDSIRIFQHHGSRR